MQYPRPHAQLRRLTTVLCEGTIAPDEHQQLEKLLADDPAARRFYYDYIALHAELAWSNVAGDSQKSLLCLEANGEVETDPDATPLNSPAKSPAKSPILGFLGDCFEQGPGSFQQGGSLWLVLFTLFAAIGTLGLLLLTMWPSDAKLAETTPTTQTIARLVETVDCKWSPHAKNFNDNAALASGETLKLDSGLAKIAFDGLAEIIVEGPAEFHIESAMSAKLLSGRLSAKVTEKGHGFTIHGPKMRVLDLGTEFGLSIDDNGQSQVHVFKGEVEVALMRHDGRAIRSQLITQHKAAALDSQDGKIGDLRLDPAEFIRTFEASDLDITREYVQSVKALRPVAYWRFEYLDGGRILNEMGNRYHGHSPTRLVLSPDVQNKTLAVDQRRDDKQYMVVEEPLTELKDSNVTVEFWIKPDKYQWTTPVTLFNSKLNKYGHEPVAGLLELLPNERLIPDRPARMVRLLHRLPASYLFADGTNCYSTVEYRPGFWHHIVGIYDGKQMRLFLNGQPVASATITGRLDFAPCISIGRPPGCISKGWREVNKEMVGQIDEVAVYNRALSADQVAEHYRLGKKATTEQ